MALGFPPKYIQNLNLESSDKEYHLVIVNEAIAQLGWNVSFVSENKIIAYTNFSMSSWGEKVTVTIENGAVTFKSECTGIQFTDWGRNKNNIAVLVSTYSELKNSLSNKEKDEKLSELKQNSNIDKNAFQNDQSHDIKNEVFDFISIFKPTEGYLITPILIGLNLLVFIAMVISGVHILSPDNQSLLDWGANFKPLTLDGEWWRLLTACFLHIGILHLLLNIYALLYIGILLEPYLGGIRFVAAYLISGIAASIISLWWNDFTISAGASGAIFGMYGVFLALMTTNIIEKSVKNAFWISTVFFIGYNIFNGLSPDSGIDNAAHVGGLLSGIIVGYSFIPSLKKFNNFVIKFSTIGILTSLLFLTSFFIYNKLPNDIGRYENKMERFVLLESMALEVYNLPEDTSEERILSELSDRGIYYWKENIELVKNFKELDLPEAIRNRNKLLIEYCELRIKSYELTYTAIKEKTDQYDSQLEGLRKKIDSIIAELTVGL